MHEELSKFCPKCPPIFSKVKPEYRVGVRLETVYDNYSGCGVDHCVCNQCGTLFQVTYTIDSIDVIDE